VRARARYSANCWALALRCGTMSWKHRRLAGDRAYVRSWINKRAAVQQTTTERQRRREAFTTTDLRLRDGPDANSQQIGLAEGGSRVRILSENNNWCQVDISSTLVPRPIRVS